MSKFCALFGVFALACGGSSGDDAGSGPGSGSGTGGGGSISVGSNAGTGSGTTPISSGTIDQLKNGSCAGWTAEPEGLPSVLEFVVDVSGSMNDMVPSTKGQTKWQVTRTALTAALNQFPASVGLGMLFFPNMQTRGSTRAQPVTACVNTNALIPLALLGPQGSMQRTTIANAIAAMRPNSLTPTHDAYDYALNQGLLPTMVPGKRFMVLLTDGAPTLDKSCIGSGNGGGAGGGQYKGATQPIVDEIAMAFSQGISTFVLGAPGSEQAIGGGDARPWLSAAARAGGTAIAGCADAGPNYCHQDLTTAPDFAMALSKALAGVATAAVSCTYALPTPPAGQTLDLNAINVVYTAGNGTQTLVGRNGSATCTDGWTLVGNQVTLCSNTCTQVKADAGAALNLYFGCASVPVVK